MRLIDADALRAERLDVLGTDGREVVNSIGDMPTVTLEMSAVEYERILRRFNDWCGSQFCGECDFHTDCPQSYELSFHPIPTPEQWVAFIQKWAQKHPEAVQI